jgi:TrmH family RNA methyltransferase
MTTGPLDSIRVVLYEPQDPINIGATVRAMRNMGVSSLHLVRPVAYEPERLVGVSRDTNTILAATQHHDTLEGALEGCVKVAGYTARRRAGRRLLIDAGSAADALLAASASGPVALLFGREDKGLPNEALDMAHTVVTIPTTEHASLNLAQAVLIALYEIHRRSPEATRPVAPPRHATSPATSEQFERLFNEANNAFAAIDFYKTRYPEHILRTVRSLVFRAEPDAREIELLRAMAIEVVRTVDRIRAEKP